jgi:large subunit ribosomal protein L6
MSRLGKKPILIPENVEVKIDGQKVFVKGPKGELSCEIRPEIKIEEKEGKIFSSIEKDTRKSNAFWGLSRSLIFNMIEGVTKGFEKRLELIGVGYRVSMEGEELVLKVGFSHLVKIKPPEGINISVEKNTIIVSGIDKQKVGLTAAKIRKIKPCEPYKGKGIKYVGEIIRRKVGKKAAGAE